MPIGITSLKRATGFALQPTAGTPASAPTWWAQYEMYPTIDDVATQETKKYELDSRATEGDIQPGTLHTRVKFPVDVDSREFPKYLLAGAGYAFGSLTHTFTFGDDVASYLTMWRYDGITGEMRQVSDMVLNTVEFDIDYTSGKTVANLEFLGAPWTAISAASISYATYSDSRLAFFARQAVLLRAGAAFCPITAKIMIACNAGPLYCGPSVDPVSGDPIYLAPTEIQPGELSGHLDVTARYVGYSGSLLEDSRKLTERVYQLKLTDPSSSPSKVMTWTFPRVKAPPGSEDSNITNRQQRQTIQGQLLVSAGEICTLTVVNAVGAYL